MMGRGPIPSGGMNPSMNIPGTGYHPMMNMNQNYMVNPMSQSQNSNFPIRPPIMMNNMMMHHNMSNIQRMPHMQNIPNLQPIDKIDFFYLLL
jgi:hypothetical protein